jgi:hypothetical protein
MEAQLRLLHGVARSLNMARGRDDMGLKHRQFVGRVEKV